MQPHKCPHCGAPAQFAPGQQTYQCTYCKQAFHTGQAPPQPAYSPPQPQQIVIVAPHIPQFGEGIAHEVTSGVSLLLRVVLPLIIVAVVGVVFFVVFLVRSSGGGGLGSLGGWDGTTPFDCGGNEDISVTGVTANFNAGTAITVGGNCHFKCTDCTIKAPTAIDVGGNGQVTIINGKIEGTDTLVEAGGNARVNISGNVVASGQVKKSANARVSAPSPPPTPEPEPAATPAAVDAGKGKTGPAAPKKR
jgi:hypothetical protein